MNKVIETAADAIADIPDGASIAIAGFGLAHRFPNELMTALLDTQARDLTIVCNSWGRFARDLAGLIDDRRVIHLVTSLSARAGEERTEVEDRIAAGEISVELVPQGTLVERLRAGGAGLAGFYTPTGIGTRIAEGREVREFDGKAYLFEPALRVDFALVRAARADRSGNLEFRGGSRHFNVSFAKAARVAVAEVDEIVEPGGLDAERIGLPGVFVARVVAARSPVDLPALIEANRMRKRPPDAPRTYLGKPALSRSQVAARAAALLPEGGYVNLGAGIPSLVSDHIAGRDIVLHTENGILGYGRVVEDAAIDLDHYTAGSRFVSLRPDASFFDSVTSFEMVRGGKLSAVVLGAYQVDAAGSLANWTTPEQVGGGIGGAMDLAAGDNRVIVCMEHCDTAGRPKLLPVCTYPVTGLDCVDTVVTDLALLVRRSGRFVLTEIAPGFSVAEVVGLTGMELELAEPVATMTDALAP